MSGKLNLTSDELKKHLKKKTKDTESLFKFIDEKVHPKIRKELNFLIEKCNEDNSDITCSKNQLYYEAGFSEGVKMILGVLKF